MIVKGRLGFRRFWSLLPNSQQSNGSCTFKRSKAEPASIFSNGWVLRAQRPPASQPPRRPRSQIPASFSPGEPGKKLEGTPRRPCTLARPLFAAPGCASLWWAGCRGTAELGVAQAVRREEERRSKKFALSPVKTSRNKIRLGASLSCLRKPPIVPAGLAPTPAKAAFVGAALEAGCRAELAGGGRTNAAAPRAKRSSPPPDGDDLQFLDLQLGPASTNLEVDEFLQLRAVRRRALPAERAARSAEAKLAELVRAAAKALLPPSRGDMGMDMDTSDDPSAAARAPDTPSGDSELEEAAPSFVNGEGEDMSMLDSPAMDVDVPSSAVGSPAASSRRYTPPPTPSAIRTSKRKRALRLRVCSIIHNWCYVQRMIDTTRTRLPTSDVRSPSISFARDNQPSSFTPVLLGAEQQWDTFNISQCKVVPASRCSSSVVDVNASHPSSLLAPCTRCLQERCSNLPASRNGSLRSMLSRCTSWKILFQLTPVPTPIVSLAILSAVLGYAIKGSSTPHHSRILAASTGDAHIRLPAGQRVHQPFNPATESEPGGIGTRSVVSEGFRRGRAPCATCCFHLEQSAGGHAIFPPGGPRHLRKSKGTADLMLRSAPATSAAHDNGKSSLAMVSSHARYAADGGKGKAAACGGGTMFALSA
ncbi:uncharacterized protein B0H18DRAFT_1119597 [Fomitopsis serialis]|uniref:uncharacterized protein n=1 Tax=Fomitopsis serialis TaxID=139415 RepID=UPI00200821FC|nr:uncharacterized protein B0H18DRAFT_1119597 [Neoantrodia serialis]KAH9925168.1 hypothetical protein B0H18DRAFT_1119597 [Neoantrodia serialis]